MTTKTKASRFAKGSGCYQCYNCKRLTRSTGRGDNESVQLCVECYELAGLENEIADSGETPELVVEINRLIDVVRSKGGVL